MDIKPIRSARDYRNALRRIEALWDSAADSPESDELDVLATLVEAYERDHFPIHLPDPVAAIQFRLEQQGLDSRALVGVIGGRPRVYEVLHRKRSLSLNMIRNLSEKFGIPVQVLVQPVRGRKKIRRLGTRLRQVQLKKSA
jgi:HTH-type transcriptional regulator / antitoxin HigA